MKFKLKKQHIHIFILITACALLFGNTFKNPFMWDDKYVFVDDKHIKDLRNIPYFFSPHYWQPAPFEAEKEKGEYRPISAVSFAIDHALWGLNPAGFHLTNLLLHTANVLLVYFVTLILAKLAGISRKNDDDLRLNSIFFDIPFLCAIFFAAHPVHTESVTWIKNRTDILASLFMLASFIVFIKHLSCKGSRRCIILYSTGLFFFAAALLSKAMAVTLPLILLLFIFYFLPAGKRVRSALKTAPFFIMSLAFIALKTCALGMPGLPSEKIPDASLCQHIMIVFQTMGFYFKMLLFPLKLNAAHPMFIPESFLEEAVLYSMAAMFFLIFAITKTFREEKLLSFSISWIILTLLPVSNIVLLSGRPVAEQRLYIPSVGFCMILSIGLSRLRSTKIPGVTKKALANYAAVPALAILAFYSATTVTRNRDWIDPVTFWSKTQKNSPLQAVASYNLANALVDAGETDKALLLLEKAARLDPTQTRIYNNLGVEYMARGETAKAVAMFTKSAELNPMNVDALNNLGDAYQKSGKPMEAITAYKKAIKAAPDNPSVYINLGAAYGALGQINRAADLINKSLKFDPYNPNAYYNLGKVYGLMGKKDEAIKAYNKAITLDPDYAEAYYNLGIEYSETGDFKNALTAYEKVLKTDPFNVAAYNNIGVLYNISFNSPERSIEFFEKALDIDPGYAPSYNNLAIVYYNMKNYSLAIECCDKASNLGHKNPRLIKRLIPYRKIGQ
ncbi:MAG: tetratricopeptide repeat protein [Candidatus Omnitrophota bacterium]